MKKFLLALLLVLLVGCKKNLKEEVICNYKSGNRENQIIIYFTNSKSVSYDKKSTVTLDSSIEASNYKIDDNYDSISVDDKVVSMHVNEAIEDMTKVEIMSLYEKIGYICK